jgi:voltage-gated potassium channel
MVTGLILVAVFVLTIWAIWRDSKARPLLYLTMIVLLGGTLFYHSVEGWSLLDSLYFCVITLATIGFGDLAPKTDQGKAFTILYIFVGFGVLASFIRLIAQRETLRRGARHPGLLSMLFGGDDDDDDDDKHNHKTKPKTAGDAEAAPPPSPPPLVLPPS